MLFRLPNSTEDNNSSFAFAQLLDDDSAFKHLFENTGEESSYKILQDQKLKPKLHSIYQLTEPETLLWKKQIIKKSAFKGISDMIFNLSTTESQFAVKEREIIEEILEKPVIVDLTLKFFNNLKILKEIEKQKCQYIQKKLKLEKHLSLQSEEIMKFSAMVYFESNKAVSIKKIPKNNTQFARCEKALRDNSVKGFFDDSEYGDFKLIEAYRIENSIRLSEFEQKLAK